jgi:cellulose synthase/poly-beta-1,6-N-acetylglucosamine synthase-like glycosyltransferase
LIYLFYTLAGLLVVQGILSLVEGIRFRSFLDRSLREPPSGFKPRAAIIVPCKGLDKGLGENLRRLMRQDYPEYEVIFSIASIDDPARAVIETVIAEHPGRDAALAIAAPSRERGEKINNLLHAVEHVGQGCRVLVFADSDARVTGGWLESLVSPLNDARFGAATGYRWYLPERGGFWSALLSSWNGSVATTLGDHGRNFAWGGSTAIRRDVFDQIGVARRWQRAVSDDYALTRAVQEAGLLIRFVPRCLVETREDARLSSLIEFTTRQVIITRVYRPRIWWTGLLSHTLFVALFFGGLVWLGVRLAGGNGLDISFSMMLGAIYALGSAKGALRLLAARDALPHARMDLARLWWMFCLLWPLVSLLFFYNFIKSATTRRITWRGVCYELRSPTETIVFSKHCERAPSGVGLRR